VDRFLTWAEWIHELTQIKRNEDPKRRGSSFEWPLLFGIVAQYTKLSPVGLTSYFGSFHDDSASRIWPI